MLLDPGTLPPNTRVTLVGEITGSMHAKLDEMDYRYPTVIIQHLHVWPEPEWEQPNNSGPRFGIFGGGSNGGRVGGGVSIGIGFYWHDGRLFFSFVDDTLRCVYLYTTI